MRYYVYIITNKNKTVLYVGITNNLSRRLQQHAESVAKGQDSFAGRYKCIYLLYFEEYISVHDAISREKELKGWVRVKKIALIRTTNPELKFLN